MESQEEVGPPGLLSRKPAPKDRLEESLWRKSFDKRYIYIEESFSDFPCAVKHDFRTATQFFQWKRFYLESKPLEQNGRRSMRVLGQLGVTPHSWFFDNGQSR